MINKLWYTETLMSMSYSNKCPPEFGDLIYSNIIFLDTIEFACKFNCV